MKTFTSLVRALVIAGAVPLMVSARFDLQPDRDTHVYRQGEEMTWTITWTGEGPQPTAPKFVLNENGMVGTDEGVLSFEEGVATFNITVGEPGTLLVEVLWSDENDEVQTDRGGLAVEPEKIGAAEDAPEDFDAFWAEKIAELEAVPMEPQLTPRDVGVAGVDYALVSMNNIRGTSLNGQVACPTEGETFPALLRVQWAGVYGLQTEWVTDRARQGWLALNILPHDLPIDEEETFYAEHREGPLENYFLQGSEDRDTSYFLRMYLSCYRAVEYLKSRPDWNGEVLVVTGTSQGGQQAFVTAGLHPDVTAAMALVPAGADFNGVDHGRDVGFPFWRDLIGERDEEAVRQAGGYFDIVNFARRVRAPMLIGNGLKDVVCPPAGIFAAANQLEPYHEMVILPDSGHQNVDGSQDQYGERAEVWLAALREGLTPPVNFDRNADHALLREALSITAMRSGANPNSEDPASAPNYDETKAEPYPDYPDTLMFDDGTSVAGPADWPRRREELIVHFTNEVYGRVPDNVPGVNWVVESETTETKGGVDVVTKQLAGVVDNSAYPFIEVSLDLSLSVPADAAGPVPVMLHFGWPPRILARFPRPPGPTWEEQVLQHGWAVATLVPTSFQADNGEGLTSGIIGLANAGQPRSPEQWGALRAWAWGASRALDYFENDPAVDASQAAIEGLSRYGKAAAVAMAFEPRFAIGFIGSSGKGGLALHRRDFGERVENLTGTYAYHWMAGNYLKYGSTLTPADLPVDAHQLVALFAPRPAFISVGSPDVEGQWIDQRGTFKATAMASPVYEFLDQRGLGTDDYPGTGPARVTGELAWRQHEGGHTTLPNWPVFLDWADHDISAPTDDRWVGTWSTAPQLTEERNEPPAPQFENATVRQHMLTSIGGDAFRVRFSNQYGDGPITLDAAAVAQADGGGRIKPGTSYSLTFGGSDSITLQPGAWWISDVVEAPLEPVSHLAITIQTPANPDGITGHPGSRTTSYFIYDGSPVDAPDLSAGTMVDRWYYLSGIDVLTDEPDAAAIAVLGDSITDGRGSTTNGNDRWPDVLSERLRADPATAHVAVLNQGIGGNAVVRGGLGPTLLARLDHDVLAQPGVKWVVLLEGINDLGGGRTSAKEIIAAYDQVITRVHDRGLKIYGATIMPYAECFYWSEVGETKRVIVNDWIRHSGRFDAVIDFDQVARDPANPLKLLPAYDTGDHLHLNQIGLRALGDAIDLGLFAE
jgi:cephalosporin-C deacetylase-like acetyl esterase/lysophospholipase L1-like esterase